MAKIQSKKRSQARTAKRVRPGIIVAALAIHAFVVTATLRDLAQRPAAEVRGPKMLWRVVGTANTGGAIAYWLLGRKRP